MCIRDRGSTDGMVQVSTHTARGFIPMMELIDREKELARLNKEKAKAEKELAKMCIRDSSRPFPAGGADGSAEAPARSAACPRWSRRGCGRSRCV